MDATFDHKLFRGSLGPSLRIKPFTIMPLALFSAAVRRVDLSLVGILQYVGPTLQFLVGAVLYSEPLYPTRMVGFVLGSWLKLFPSVDL